MWPFHICIQAGGQIKALQDLKGSGGLSRHRAHSYTCEGVTLGSGDLINIPACKANLFPSEGCSCNGASHEGDIGAGRQGNTPTWPHKHFGCTNVCAAHLIAVILQLHECCVWNLMVCFSWWPRCPAAGVSAGWGWDIILLPQPDSQHLIMLICIKERHLY